MTEHNDQILQEALNDLADIQLVDNTWQQADVAKAEILEHVRDMAAAYGASIEAIKAENERLTAENEKLKNRHTKLWNALDFLASKENYEDGVDHTILFVNDEDGWFHPANFALQALEEASHE